MKSTDPHFGYNAENGTWGDMLAAGIVDPTKVTRSPSRTPRPSPACS